VGQQLPVGEDEVVRRGGDRQPAVPAAVRVRVRVRVRATVRARVRVRVRVTVRVSVVAAGG